MTRPTILKTLLVCCLMETGCAGVAYTGENQNSGYDNEPGANDNQNNINANQNQAVGCGNGIQEENESCDDGTQNSDTAPNACRTDCTLPRCGDGVVDDAHGEACDDGAQNSDTAPNACRTDCTLPRCGDGVADLGFGETCDDGNQDDGDNCSADCTIAFLSRTAVHFDMVADSTGTIHVIWKPGIGDYKYGLLQGDTITEINTIPDSGNVKRNRSKPRLAVQEGGSPVHVLLPSSGAKVVTHAWYQGSAWSSEVLWSNPDLHRWEAMLAVCPNGALHAIAQMDGAPYNRIAYYHRPAGATSWQDESVLFEAPPSEEVRDTFIVCDETGDVHAGWTRYYGLAPGGSTPMSVSALPKPPGANLVCCGDMALGDDLTVHYAFKVFPQEKIAYSYRPPDGSWAEPETDFSEDDLECYPDYPDYEVWPAIAVGDDGRIFISWAYSDCESSDAPFVDLAVRETDGTWTTVKLDTNAAICSHSKPALAKANGVVNVLWTVLGSDGPELVLHRIDTSVPTP